MGEGRRMLTGMAIGAGLAYWWDPQQGARRRALVRDQIVHMMRMTEEGAEATARDARNRGQGIVAEFRRMTSGEQPDDRVLEERVRARIGGAIRHPGSIEVHAEDGTVTLGGPILADEVDEALRRAARTRGVRSVRNLLQVYEEPGNIPGLQGQGRLPTRQAWSPSARVAAGTAGAMLASGGLRGRGLRGLLMTGSGIGLLGRAIYNRPISRVTGIAAGRRAVEIQKAIEIEQPIEKVFEFWSKYENFPEFMSHVRQVRMIDEKRSHWVADGPAGSTVEWHAIETKRIPNEVIAWKTEPGSVVQHAGVVRFERQDGSTRVTVHLSYNPLAGAAGHLIASLLRADPKKQMDDDLMRVKTLLETGKPAHDAAAR